MTSRFITTLACIAVASIPAFAQTGAKAAIVKHLTTSRDFTLKVAEQMPEADYAFKLTPPQMSWPNRWRTCRGAIAISGAFFDRQARSRKAGFDE